MQAAIELAELSNQLGQLIGQFKLNGRGQAHSHALVAQETGTWLSK
ncbi:MAG: hypothetical protein O7E52_00930 [Candidatus Poribacteria bacterium]|nr:hypothetical protein [Candidatus Poribacteria bacterium]